MMPRLIDKSKIYFYLALLFILLSLHNLNSTNFINNFFQIKHIIINDEIDLELKNEIYSSLNNLYNINIFTIDSEEIAQILEKFNIISEYKINKIYPSSIIIELKETNILAYYLNQDKKVFIGENGKKINKISNLEKTLPLITGDVDIKKFLEFYKKLSINGFDINNFTKFNFSNSNRWDFIYKNKIIVKLPIENIDDSLFKFKEIILNRNFNDFKVIDLRIKNNIIIL